MQQLRKTRTKIRTWCCIVLWSLSYARKAVHMCFHMYSARRIWHVQYSSNASSIQERANPANVAGHVTTAPSAHKLVRRDPGGQRSNVDHKENASCILVVAAAIIVVACEVIVVSVGSAEC